MPWLLTCGGWMNGWMDGWQQGVCAACSIIQSWKEGENISADTERRSCYRTSPGIDLWLIFFPVDSFSSPRFLAARLSGWYSICIFYLFCEGSGSGGGAAGRQEAVLTQGTAAPGQLHSPHPLLSSCSTSWLQVAFRVYFLWIKHDTSTQTAYCIYWVSSNMLF